MLGVAPLVAAALVAAAAGCVKVKPFDYQDGGTAGSDADADVSGDGAVPFEGRATATLSNGKVIVTMPDLYTWTFADMGYEFPEALEVDGAQVFSANSTAADQCESEHGTGISFAPAAAITGVSRSGVSGGGDTITIEVPGPGVAKVTIEWNATFGGCNAMPSGRSSWTFFPDGRITRMDYAHLTQPFTATSCECNANNSQTTWELSSYYELDSSVITPTTGGSISTTGNGVSTPFTQPVLCMTGAGDTGSFYAAIGHFNAKGQRIRRIDPNGFAVIADMLDTLPTMLGGGTSPIGDVITHMYLSRAIDCTKLDDSVRALHAGDPHIIVASNLGSEPKGLAQDGLYGGETSGTAGIGGIDFPGDPNLINQITITARGTDVVPAFGVWLNLNLWNVTGVMRTPASTRQTWFTRQDYTMPKSGTPGGQVFWFPDGVKGDETITIGLARK